MSSKLRIKVDHDSKLTWMLCDNLPTIKDLHKKIKQRFNLKKVDLYLEDAVLPMEESIEILSRGDVIALKISKDKKKAPSPSSSSSSSNDEEPPEITPKSSNGHIKKEVSMKKTVSKPLLMSSSSSSTSSEGEEISEKPFKTSEKKRKRRRKNKNKNKLPEQELEVAKGASKIDTPKNVPLNVPSQGKHIKFTDDDEQSSPPKKTKLAAMSQSINCEDFLLKEVTQAKVVKDTKSLDALLKLAEKPITVKAKKQVTKDVNTNKSVILTNTKLDFDIENLAQYETHQGAPEKNRTFAFKCLQIGPDYTPQMTQYVGELQDINSENLASFLILFDENEGKARSDKFEVDTAINGLMLKNQTVSFHWDQLSDIRLVK